jgi:starch phosphorylase
MKAALNGGLNLSIRDGWWDELYDGENGWAIPSAEGVSDTERRDDLESAAIFDLLETSVLPRFYERTGGVPRRWTEMVRHTLRSLGPEILASRMVRDYVVSLYAPAAASAATMAADGYAAARALAAWKQRVRAAWPGVRVDHVESTGVGDTPQLGNTVTIRALVTLGGLAPEDVDAQAAYGRVGTADELRAPRHVSLQPAGQAGDGQWAYEGEIPLDLTGAYGYTVRVLPRHELLASAPELGLMAGP